MNANGDVELSLQPDVCAQAAMFVRGYEHRQGCNDLSSPGDGKSVIPRSDDGVFCHSLQVH